MDKIFTLNMLLEYLQMGRISHRWVIHVESPQKISILIKIFFSLQPHVLLIEKQIFIFFSHKSLPSNKKISLNIFYK